MTQGQVLSRSYQPSHNELNSTNTVAFNNGLGEGSSGGPVLDENGQVIAVNDAGGEGNSIAIRASIVSNLVHKAKGRLFPSSTDLCAVPPNSINPCQR